MNESKLRILPRILVDATGDSFEIESQESWAGEPGGVKNAALYRMRFRGPSSDVLYTPDLAFCEQLTDTPIMRAMA